MKSHILEDILQCIKHLTEQDITLVSVQLCLIFMPFVHSINNCSSWYAFLHSLSYGHSTVSKKQVWEILYSNSVGKEAKNNNKIQQWNIAEQIAVFGILIVGCRWQWYGPPVLGVLQIITVFFRFLLSVLYVLVSYHISSSCDYFPLYFYPNPSVSWLCTCQMGTLNWKATRPMNLPFPGKFALYLCLVSLLLITSVEDSM